MVSLFCSGYAIISNNGCRRRTCLLTLKNPYIKMAFYHSFVYNNDCDSYVIVVTQARVRCLICTHDVQGRAAPEGECGHTGNARVPVLQLICYTSGTLKSAQIV